MQIYKIPMFNDAQELLRYVAQKRGKVRHVRNPPLLLLVSLLFLVVIIIIIYC